MCEQCTTNCITFGEVIPGFYLMRARRDGLDWKKGQWGLVESNDPTFIWSSTPLIDNTKEEWDIPEEFEHGLTCYPMDGYKLIKSAMKAGYNPKTDGTFEVWFWHYLSHFIDTHDFTGDNHDPLNNTIDLTDYSIGKQAFIL